MFCPFYAGRRQATTSPTADRDAASIPPQVDRAAGGEILGEFVDSSDAPVHDIGTNGEYVREHGRPGASAP